MRTYLYLAGLFCVSSLAACGSDTASAPTSLNGCNAANAVVSTDITVKGYAFLPSCVKVTAGSSLTFVNKDSVAHTVTSDAGAPNTFDNRTFNANEVVTQPFTQAGATGVHCTFHPSMLMTVIVE